jgi:hypothetical protein
LGQSAARCPSRKYMGELQEARTATAKIFRRRPWYPRRFAGGKIDGLITRESRAIESGDMHRVRAGTLIKGRRGKKLTTAAVVATSSGHFEGEGVGLGKDSAQHQFLRRFGTHGRNPPLTVRSDWSRKKIARRSF